MRGDERGAALVARACGRGYVVWVEAARQVPRERERERERKMAPRHSASMDGMKRRVTARRGERRRRVRASPLLPPPSLQPSRLGHRSIRPPRLSFSRRAISRPTTTTRRPPPRPSSARVVPRRGGALERGGRRRLARRGRIVVALLVVAVGEVAAPAARVVSREVRRLRHEPVLVPGPQEGRDDGAVSCLSTQRLCPSVGGDVAFTLSRRQSKTSARRRRETYANVRNAYSFTL